jgi:hypothetical protein
LKTAGLTSATVHQAPQSDFQADFAMAFEAAMDMPPMAPGVEAKFIIGYVRGLGWGRRIVEALTPA